MAQTRAETEAQLRSIDQQLSKLSRELEAARGQYGREQRALKQVDLRIQDSQKTLLDLQHQEQEQEQELELLEQQRAVLLQQMATRRHELSRQIGAAYRLGGQSKLKLLLNQNDPNQVSRFLHYYRYFNQARLAQIDQVKADLAELDQVQSAINQKLAQIETLQSAQQVQLASLRGQREAREQVVGELNLRIGDQQTRISELKKNRADLERLLQRLSQALNDIPQDLGHNTSLATQRGRLPRPLNGPIRQRFGQSRQGGMTWQGWLLAAPGGTPVQAVGYGRVAFADWLRGYGLLLIIDHGEGYLSLYGHNETLLKDVGDWVQSGETISTAGNSGGSSESGLYFELRKDGKAINPKTWIK